MAAHPTIPAAQYLRMSSDQQHTSLEHQAKLIAKFAAAEGYEIIQTYEDAGRSGVTVAGRAGLKALLRDVVSGPDYTTILVADVSRWGRYQDPDEAAHYEFLCRDAGVRVRYCAEAFNDDGSMASSLVKSVKRMMAAEYSRQLSDRCRAGIRRVQEAGGTAGGPAPYGFARAALDHTDGTLRVLRHGERKPHVEDRVTMVNGSPQQVAVVRRIFDMFVNQVESTGSIAQQLQSEAIPYSRPGPWTNWRVKLVLTNELAIGVHVFNRAIHQFGRRERLPADHWRRIKVCRGIVSKQIFAEAQERLAGAARGLHPSVEMLAALKRIYADHGRLDRHLVREHSGSRPELYKRRFGSLRAAYRLAGHPMEGPDGKYFERGAMSREEVMEALGALLVKEGYLSNKLIDQTNHLPHSATLLTRYGPLSDLYKELGWHLSKNERLKLAHARSPKRRMSRLGANG